MVHSIKYLAVALLSLIPSILVIVNFDFVYRLATSSLVKNIRLIMYLCIQNKNLIREQLFIMLKLIYLWSRIFLDKKYCNVSIEL